MASRREGQLPLGTEDSEAPAVNARSSAAAKVRLFRDLFRGRPDVYPRLWVNEARGTKGYAPAHPQGPPAASDDNASAEPLPAAELDAMIDDVLVASFTRQDQAIAFFEVLNDELELPFSASAGRTTVSVESLSVSRHGQVIAHCSTETGRRRRIPLARLVPRMPAPLGWEWAEAHRRWVKLQSAVDRGVKARR